jgi:hypothetical protein
MKKLVAIVFAAMVLIGSSEIILHNNLPDCGKQCADSKKPNVYSLPRL